MKTLPTINVEKGRLRVIVRQNERRHFIYLGLPDTKHNRKIAEEIKELIQLDIESGCFDESLNKYKFHQTLGKRIYDLSPSEMISQWLKEEKSREVCKTTLDWYKRIENDLAKLFPNLKARDLKGTHCKQYIRYLEKNENQPYGIKRKIQGCNQAWIWLIDNHYLTFNPWSAFTRKVKVNHQEMVKPFSECEITAILNAFENHKVYWQYKPFVEFLFFTGCRTGEVIGLQWEDISNDLSEITIRSQLTRGVRKATKTGRARSFLTSERIRNILLPLKNLQSKLEGLVFKYNNHPVDLNNFRTRAWKACLALANVSYRKCYLTRATFVSLALAEGLTPIYIAQITGHSPRTMYQHYAGFIQDKPALPF